MNLKDCFIEIMPQSPVPGFEDCQEPSLHQILIEFFNGGNAAPATIEDAERLADSYIDEWMRLASESFVNLGDDYEN